MKKREKIGVVRLHIEKQPEGCFSITSQDMLGLLLAGHNLEKLINDVPGSIELLYELNHGKKIKVGEAVSGEEMAKARPNILSDQLWAFTLTEG